ncbi:hypothetical protein M0802_000524 [Mischocyttarus mexicanus]|nr:hypothetical protein M0802_000524 [Mischocyttarus mexicanus]
MRNPALHLVGIAASPGGDEIFGTRAEEELRQWLETRLDALGIDPVAYSRFVLSLLRRPDSALSPPEEAVSINKNIGRRSCTRPKAKLPSQGEREQRRAVVQYLKSAADNKCGVETLVDELCTKLRDLEGGGSHDEKEESRKLDSESKTNLEVLTPFDRALRYYAAFPALQPTSLKTFSQRKDKTFGNNNNNNNNTNSSINYNNNKNSNKAYNTKTKMPITIETQRREDKESFGFAKFMEREREKERELELDQLRLAQLQAKFDESLEALWDSGPGNAQDTASIWAAPTLSIPSGPLWPTDTTDTTFTLSTADNGCTSDTPYQECVVDDSPLIPWDIDLISIEDYVEECSNKNKSEALWDSGPGNAQDTASIWAAPTLSIPSGPLWPTDTTDTTFTLSTADNGCTSDTPYQECVVDDSPLIPWDIDLISIEDYVEECSNKNKSESNINWSDTVIDGPWCWKGLGNNLTTLGHSSQKGSCFFPVAPRKTPIGTRKESRSNLKIHSLPEPDEDLLTSARTHFRPIKDDGNWADGTTFPVNNALERVAYRRSESGNLLYLPGGESPYMEYRESNSPIPSTSSNLTLKFRVRQCDKCVQTEPIRSPIKRRIISEQDHFHFSPVETEETIAHEQEKVEKDYFSLSQERLKPGFLQKYDHYTVPGYNLNTSFGTDNRDLNYIRKFYQKFPYEHDLPKPLLPPAKLPRTVLHEEDPALEPVAVKSYMKSDINRILDYYEKRKDDFGPTPKKGVKWLKNNDNLTSAVLPRYVAELAELVELDPDPYLKGNYNWYYTGGSLTNVTLGDQTILIYPYVGELVASPLMPMENALWKPILQKSDKLNLDGVILGRYKNHCILYKLTLRGNKVELFEFHKKASTLPYVSGEMCPCIEDYFCTIDVNRMLSLWNVNRKKNVASYKVIHSKVMDDSWGSIKYQLLDPHVLVFIDRCCLHYLDTRIPFDQPSLSLCPKQFLEECESLSVEKVSRHSSCRYVGTYHNLLLCDNRSPKKCVSQKWTHQFRSTPLLFSTVNRNEEEILVLSSPLVGESLMILNTWTYESPHSYNLPITLPSIKETLNEAQLQGLCLDPYMKNRLELCKSGSTLVTDQKGDVFFFVQTSIGDVFYQCITHKDILDKNSETKVRAISALNAWEHALTTQDNPIVPITMSSKCDMKHVYKSFKNKHLQLDQYEELDDTFDQNWRKSIEELSSYEDILASELLAVWGISEQVSISLSATPHQKVLNWLEMNNDKATSFSLDEMEYMGTPEDTQELISVSQNPDSRYLNNSYNNEEEPFLPKVKTKSIERKKKSAK